MGKLTRCLGAAALIALLASTQTESALAIPFNANCGGQANVDTDPPTLVTCTLVDVGPINDLIGELEARQIVVERMRNKVNRLEELFVKMTAKSEPKSAA